MIQRIITLFLVLKLRKGPNCEDQTGSDIPIDTSLVNYTEIMQEKARDPYFKSQQYLNLRFTEHSFKLESVECANWKKDNLHVKA